MNTVYDYTHELNPASVSNALGAGTAGHSDKAFAAMQPVRFWIDLCCAHQKPALTSEALDFDPQAHALRPMPGDGPALQRRRLKLERCIAACPGGTILWWCPWDAPTALTRARHLWELYITATSSNTASLPLILAIPEAEYRAMRESDGFKLRLVLEQVMPREGRGGRAEGGRANPYQISIHDCS